MKRNNFLTAMLGVLLVFGLAGCNEGLATGAQKALEGMASYSIVLGGVAGDSSYTAVVYDKTEAVGSGEAPAVNGSASIKLTPYNGKPPFSERAYRVWISCGTTVKEAPSVGFVAGGNTQLDWSKMALIEGGTEEEAEEEIEETGEDEGIEEGEGAATGLNITFSGGDPGKTYYIEVYDAFGEEIASLEDIYDYEYPLIAAGALPDGGGTLPNAPLLTGDYYVVIQDNFYRDILGSYVYFDNGNANFDLSALLPLYGVGDPDPTADAIISLASAFAYLSSHADGSVADNPVPLKLRINLSSATNGWNALIDGLLAAGKYAALDLSLCSMNGTKFDLYAGAVAGKNNIVSLVLPNSATSIARPSVVVSTSTSDGYINNSYSKLRTVSGANVITIGVRAFYNCTSLTSVSFPKATSIGSYAFDGCTSLTTAPFPNATNIGDYAFYQCTALTTVSFPEATSIEAEAFYGCTGLTTVSFPEVTSIGYEAFWDCTSLTTVSFPKATSIENYAFLSCTSLTTVSFPEATSIGVAFKDCTALTEVSAPKATSVSFSGCTALTEVSFPEATSVSLSWCTAIPTIYAPKATSISLDFYGTSLTSVSLPEATSISFSGCTALTSVSAPNATSVYFSGCTALTSVSAPNATSVGFSECTALTSVSAPEATYVEFSGCTSLTSVSFPQVTSVWFSWCTSLADVSAPKAIDVLFVSCTALASVSFPEATDIWVWAGCTSLTTVSLPKVTYIGQQAFQSSGTAPLTITMGAVAPTVGWEIFTGVTGTKNVTVRVPSGATGYTDAWQTAFKGGNSYINVVIQYGE